MSSLNEPPELGKKFMTYSMCEILTQAGWGLRSCWQIFQNPPAPMFSSLCMQSPVSGFIPVCAKYAAEIFCTHDSNKYGGPP